MQPPVAWLPQFRALAQNCITKMMNISVILFCQQSGHLACIHDAQHQHHFDFALHVSWFLWPWGCWRLSLWWLSLGFWISDHSLQEVRDHQWHTPACPAWRPGRVLAAHAKVSWAQILFPPCICPNHPLKWHVQNHCQSQCHEQFLRQSTNNPSPSMMCGFQLVNDLLGCWSASTEVGVPLNWLDHSLICVTIMPLLLKALWILRIVWTWVSPCIWQNLLQ